MPNISQQYLPKMSQIKIKKPKVVFLPAIIFEQDKTTCQILMPSLNFVLK